MKPEKTKIELLKIHSETSGSSPSRRTALKKILLPLKSGTGKRERGSALIAVLISSAIGLIVIHGVTKSLVQSRLNQLILERKDKRRGVHAYLNKIFSDYGTCLKTLEGKDLSGSSSDTERSFEIDSIKDPDGNTLLNLAKNSDGDLTDAETKERLKNFGIDRFTEMKFVYRPAKAGLGRIVLKTESRIKGFYEKKNPEIVWELSGIKVEAVSGAGDQVTRCSDSHFLRTLCGVGVNGQSHENGGGFVQDTASVDPTAYVASGAVVCGIAQVKDTSRILQDAQVKGKAVVQNGSRIYGNALVSGGTVDNAEVYGNARVSGDALVKNSAKVYGQAKVFGNAYIHSGVNVYGEAQVYGNVKARGPNVEIYGNAKVFGMTDIDDYHRYLPSLTKYIKIYGNAQVSNGQVGRELMSGSQVEIYGDAVISGGNIQIGKVFGEAEISGSLRLVKGTIRGEAYLSAGTVSDGAEIFGNARMTYEYARIYGASTKVYGNARINGRVQISNGARVHGNAIVSGSSRVQGNLGGDVDTNGKHIDPLCDCVKEKPAGATKMVMNRHCNNSPLHLPAGARYPCSASPSY